MASKGSGAGRKGSGPGHSSVNSRIFLHFIFFIHVLSNYMLIYLFIRNDGIHYTNRSLQSLSKETILRAMIKLFCLCDNCAREIFSFLLEKREQRPRGSLTCPGPKSSLVECQLLNRNSSTHSLALQLGSFLPCLLL